MLFLGAGASAAAAGLKDLRGVSDEVEKTLYKKDFDQLLSDIKKHLVTSRLYNEEEIDIEITFTILNALANPTNSLKELGPFAVYAASVASSVGFLRKKHFPKIAKLEKLRQTTEKIIVEECKKIEHDKFRVYDGLFKVLEPPQGRTVIIGNEQMPPESIMGNIVTTNYDLVLENYRQKRGLPKLRNGFEDDAVEHGRTLDLSAFRPGHNIQLLKLHGSIDWFVREEDGKVFERPSEESLFDEKFKGRMMIYPVYEKYVSKDPYSHFFSYFKWVLENSNIYVVIGYSFRDPSINNAFLDALNQNRKARMIIVNKNTRGILERLRINGELRHRIHPVSRALEDSDTLTCLEEILTGRTTP